MLKHFTIVLLGAAVPASIKVLRAIAIAAAVAGAAVLLLRVM